MKEFVINVSPLETRIALIEDKRLVELLIERQESRSVVGNIYKGRVDSIVPGIQAAFIDIGFEKNGFLYVSDIAGAEGTGDFDFEEGTIKPRGSSRRGRPPSSSWPGMWSSARSRRRTSTCWPSSGSASRPPMRW